MNSRNIFLIDAAGAFFSILILCVLLKLNIGMPSKHLGILITLGCCMLVCSVSSYLLATQNWKLFLLCIAVLNLAYVFVSMFLVYCCIHTLAFWAIAFFTLELSVILILVFFECKIALKSSLKTLH